MVKHVSIKCDKCGKERKFRSSRKKKLNAICEVGHFICSQCVQKSLIRLIITIPLWMVYEIIELLTLGRVEMTVKNKCPVCTGKLRNIRKEDIAFAQGS